MPLLATNAKQLQNDDQSDRYAQQPEKNQNMVIAPEYDGSMFRLP